jgi:hypothetical protein
MILINYENLLHDGKGKNRRVAARTKQYGAMRAVGMDVRQLTKMINEL